MVRHISHAQILSGRLPAVEGIQNSETLKRCSIHVKPYGSLSLKIEPCKGTSVSLVEDGECHDSHCPSVPDIGGTSVCVTCGAAMIDDHHQGSDLLGAHHTQPLQFSRVFDDEEECLRSSQASPQDCVHFGCEDDEELIEWIRLLS